jgi:putative iron-dependent peroxidase
MPGTQHDALVWLSGSAYDVVFDMARIDGEQAMPA